MEKLMTSLDGPQWQNLVGPSKKLTSRVYRMTSLSSTFLSCRSPSYHSTAQLICTNPHSVQVSICYISGTVMDTELY